MELVPGEREAARKAIRSLDEHDGAEVVLLRQSALARRPYVPLRLRGRVHVRTQPPTEERAALLNEASEFIAAPGGSERLALEAAAAAGNGVPSDGFAEVAGELDQLYGRLAGRRRAIHIDSDPLSDREWIVCDLHTHTSWSHDCSVPADALIDAAEEIGLGAIAVTDHNVFGGALEAVELARGRDLIVIPGEEIKTKGQGEVIGLFLREEIPRGMSFEDTLAAIREQGGLVFLPHPFDRRHAIPDSADAASAPRGDRRARGLQREAADGDVQRRGAPLRAEVQRPPGRRLRRACPPGPRHRALCACASSGRPRSSS